MKWLLSWFGLWGWYGETLAQHGVEIRFGVWLRPWDASRKETIDELLRTLKADGWREVTVFYY